MKIIVHKDRTFEIIDQASTQNENEVEVIDFEFPTEYNNWSKNIVFLLPTHITPIWDIIQDNKYILPKAITQYSQVGIYIWLVNGEQDFRTETKTIYFNENKDASGQVKPKELEPINKILAEVNAALLEVDNVDINVNKSGTVTTVTISKKDGTEKSVQILDGQEGKQGEKGEPGYTPQKGIDYWTNQDKQEILNEVNNDIQEYINQPFATFKIVDGNLIAEVKEWQE